MEASDKNNLELLEAMGTRIAQLRVSRQLTQAQLAELSGVSSRTLNRLENGEGCALDGYLSVLRALGALDDIANLIRKPALSPLAQLGKKQQTIRKRVRHKTRQDGPVEPEAPWQWGDNRGE